MEILRIEPTKHKAGVTLDPNQNLFEFYGFSLPEDALGFFMPIMEWLYAFASDNDEKFQSHQKLQVIFKFSYYNTASHRAFLEIFRILRKLKEKGMNVHVKWYYETDDKSMLESGKELSEMVDLPLEFIEWNN